MIPFAGHQVSLLLHVAAVTSITVTALAAHVVGTFTDHFGTRDPWRLEIRGVSYANGVADGDGPELLNCRL